MPAATLALICLLRCSALWQSNVSGESCQGLRIPHTVIYRYYDAAQWFFTAPDGKIERKRKTHLKPVDIFEAFIDRTLEPRNTSDIYAMWMTPVMESEDDKPAERKLRIEFFDEAALREFLFERDKDEVGILQQWVDPMPSPGAYGKGTNRCYRCNWGKSMMFVDSRENNYQMDDLMRTPYERASTYDAGEKMSKKQPTREKRFIGELAIICKNMADHVKVNSNGAYDIARMMPTFKVDPQGKIWLLWFAQVQLENGGLTKKMSASTMAVEERAALPFGFASMSPLRDEMLNATQDLSRMQPTYETGVFPGEDGGATQFLHIECPECGETSVAAEMVDVPMLKILDKFKKDSQAPLDMAQMERVQAELEVLFKKYLPRKEEWKQKQIILSQVMPRAVQMSFPNLPRRGHAEELLNYYKLLNGPQRAIFRSTPVTVCANCYGQLTETAAPVNKPDIEKQKAAYAKILAARPLEKPEYLVDFNGLEGAPDIVANARLQSKLSDEEKAAVSPDRVFGPLAKEVNPGEPGYYEYSKGIEKLQDEAWDLRQKIEKNIPVREVKRGITLKGKPTRQDMKGPQLKNSSPKSKK